jgi:hypothetical protein
LKWPPRDIHGHRDRTKEGKSFGEPDLRATNTHIFGFAGHRIVVNGWPVATFDRHSEWDAATSPVTKEAAWWCYIIIFITVVFRLIRLDFRHLGA